MYDGIYPWRLCNLLCFYVRAYKLVCYLGLTSIDLGHGVMTFQNACKTVCVKKLYICACSSLFVCFHFWVQYMFVVVFFAPSIHIHLQVHFHAYVANTQTYIHTYIHTYICARTHTHTHTLTHTHTTHTYKHTGTYMHIHTNTHTHTNTDTHT